MRQLPNSNRRASLLPDIWSQRLRRDAFTEVNVVCLDVLQEFLSPMLAESHLIFPKASGRNVDPLQGKQKSCVSGTFSECKSATGYDPENQRWNISIYRDRITIEEAVGGPFSAWDKA